jgi:hemerythrin-like domain-containing protein
MGIKEYLTADHATCDETFADFEADFDAAKDKFANMARAYERHFKMEERVFFPAFESKMGSSCAPTQMMRMEHEQIRSLLAQMKEAIDANDKKRFIAIADTFIFLVQQHNGKEETILYSMGDRLLGDEAAEIVEKMKKAA